MFSTGIHLFIMTVYTQHNSKRQKPIKQCFVALGKLAVWFGVGMVMEMVGNWRIHGGGNRGDRPPPEYIIFIFSYYDVVVKHDQTYYD